MAKGQPKKLGQSLPLTTEGRVGVTSSEIHGSEMQDAKVYLELIRGRGKKGLPLERDVYKHLLDPEMYLTAYGKIYRNNGAMTPGITEETADGMSTDKINTIIEALRYERYRWSPARRVYIEKKHSTKKRPLGMPTWSDKVVQEVIRMILESYYEEQFSDHSHGFRPQRGCHTALREIHQNWLGTTWFIEGDIAQCFDRLDHTVLLAILSEKIQDGRFLHLISELFKAGYMEEWRFNQTLSGTPQGGVLSPILANIYLDRLDKFVENTLIPEYTKGAVRKRNQEYRRLLSRAYDLRKRGKVEEARKLRKQAQQMPSVDLNDPDYRRLRYVRYADDFVLGFNGPRSEAAEIKQRLEEFLRDELKLELSQTKTLITHARKEAARFLGYEIQTLQEDTKLDQRKRRSINGQIGLRIPKDILAEKCQRYMRDGKAIHRAELLQDSDFTILETYQAEYRGIVEYYRLAYNLRSLGRLKWVMEKSLTMTLASKFKMPVPAVTDKYQATFLVGEKTYKGLQVTRHREGKEPLVARWGGIPLIWNLKANLNDRPPGVWKGRTELEKRLLAEYCEYCDSQEDIAVHHIRGLKDLKKYTGREKPEWVKMMAARQRKTLVLCRMCHQDITYGRPMRRTRSKMGFMDGQPRKYKSHSRKIVTLESRMQ